jgi:hypothetical protein
VGYLDFMAADAKLYVLPSGSLIAGRAIGGGNCKTPSRSVDDNFKGGRVRCSENSPFFANTVAVTSERHKLIKTVSRIVAFVVSGYSTQEMLGSPFSEECHCCSDDNEKD